MAHMVMGLMEAIPVHTWLTQNPAPARKTPKAMRRPTHGSRARARAWL
jgi:hypothetical protein